MRRSLCFVVKNSPGLSGRGCHSVYLYWLVVVLVVMATAFPMPTFADEKPTDLEVKAAFILNFSLFSRWERSMVASEALYVGVFETNAEAKRACVKVLEGKFLGDRPVRLVFISRPEEICNCHIVYFGRAEHPSFSEYLERARTHGILTVGEGRDFLQKGGILAFFIENNRVRFLANPTEAKSSGIQLSSKLLRLASGVYP